jgi:hypothetical protein
MQKRCLHRVFEVLVAALMGALLSGYGWLILLNQEVTIQGGRKSGFATAHFAGADAFTVAVCVFFVGAAFSFFAMRLIGRGKLESSLIALAVFIQPVVFVAFR